MNNLESTLFNVLIYRGHTLHCICSNIHVFFFKLKESYKKVSRTVRQMWFVRFEMPNGAQYRCTPLRLYLIARGLLRLEEHV